METVVVETFMLPPNKVAGMPRTPATEDYPRMPKAAQTQETTMIPMMRTFVETFFLRSW